MRIDKLLAHAGFGTRKEVKKLIHDKVVFVNGIRVKSEGLDVDINKDEIKVNDEVVNYKENYYLLLNKPQGYICSTEDEAYPSVLHLVDNYASYGIYPVGRLDVDTTGLVFLTNNGKLAHYLISPKSHVDKEYEVTLDKDLTDDLIDKFLNGVTIEVDNEDYKCLPATLIIKDERHANIIIKEGKFHQIKKMFKSFDYQVIALHRIRMDNLNLNGLNEGEYRELSEIEINTLLERNMR